MNPEHEILIQRHLEGRLTPEEAERLRTLLHESAEMRDEFCTQSLLDGRLQWEFGPDRAVRVAEPVAFPRRRVLRVFVPAATAAALAIAAATFLWAPLEIASARQPVRTIARLGLAQDAKWNSDGALRTLPLGEWLPPGDLELREGSATLFFDSGTRLTMKAPCLVELIDPMRARLLSGAVSADVPPPAIGFTIDTPRGSVTDLSTSFGVSVGKDSNEVQVFKGKVLVRYGKGQSTDRLVGEKSGIALRASGDGVNALATEYRPENFPIAPPSAPIPRDPAAPQGYLHWSFDTAAPDRSFPSAGTLPGADGFPARPAGTMVTKADLGTPGPFGNALHLAGDGTFFKTAFPGVAGAGARTIAFWVRIPPDALPQNAYSIIGWGAKTRGAKWEIGWNIAKFPMRGGRPGAIRTEFCDGFTIATTDLRDGRWHHVASVFTGGRDADTATHIRHYVDGRLEGYSACQKQPVGTITTPGRAIPAIIGRYLDGTNPRFRSFHGDIDELYVFNAALTPAQILRLRDTNEPPDTSELLPSP